MRSIAILYGMSVNAAPCVSVILTMREMSVILTQIDLLSVKLTHSPLKLAGEFCEPPFGRLVGLENG